MHLKIFDCVPQRIFFAPFQWVRIYIYHPPFWNCSPAPVSLIDSPICLPFLSRNGVGGRDCYLLYSVARWAPSQMRPTSWPVVSHARDLTSYTMRRAKTSHFGANLPHRWLSSSEPKHHISTSLLSFASCFRTAFEALLMIFVNPTEFP